VGNELFRAGEALNLWPLLLRVIDVVKTDILTIMRVH
jgi:hypothetical protein